MSAETLEFQAETKRLLDLVINSIYTNKEIFLRELISNASDAIDKLHFESLTNQDILEGNEDFEIFIVPDSDTKTVTISDNGIGMTRDEVIANIGTIAQSGTRAFLDKINDGSEGNEELIGQFGVGFYSAFIVAEKVELTTRKAGETSAVKWTCEGAGEYVVARPLYCTLSRNFAKATSSTSPTITRLKVLSKNIRIIFATQLK